MRSLNGGLRLFRAFGIDVYLHWTWAVVAFIFIQRLRDEFQQPIWGAVTYISLFAIVLTHEFGHSLACKSVGGTAQRIMLWPLGGIAFVNPPLRPGAVFWSIAAGPLVNVILFPALWYLSSLFPPERAGDLGQFLAILGEINVWLLVFNLLPIYPLDGGQILHSLLWFMLGFARSLMIVSIVGLIGAAGLFAIALHFGEAFKLILALFIASQAWRGFVISRQLRRQQTDPTVPLEEQIREAAEATPPMAPAAQVEPIKDPQPLDPTTQRIVSESYEEALQRERIAALRQGGDNP